MSNKVREQNAKGRNSFVLYDDFADVLKDLTDEEAGVIFREIYAYRAYVKDQEHIDEPAENQDRMLRLVLAPIRKQLKRDWEKYLATCEAKAKNKKKDKGEQDDAESG